MTWTADRRAKQRELIQGWRPWEKSTGARTAKGKAKVSKNAVKNRNGLEMRELYKKIKRLLLEQKNFIG